MKILVACEESQKVTKAFRQRGHEAYSCDIMPCSGGRPEWHFQYDVTALLVTKWDMIIAFPPCTYLCSSGMHRTTRGLRDPQLTVDAYNFFMLFVNHPCEKIAIENPVGVMSTKYRKPDQIIQPWMFGHDASKRTCLWLKGLPKLEPTEIVEGELYCCGEPVHNDNKYGCPNCYGDKKAKRIWGNQTPSGQNKLGPSKDRERLRSETYSGVAQAMADQWLPPERPRL